MNKETVLSLLQRELAFQRGLAAFAADIRRKADGKVCGDCGHYNRGACDHTLGLLPSDEAPHSPLAVACPKWALVEPQPVAPQDSPEDRAEPGDQMLLDGHSLFVHCPGPGHVRAPVEQLV